MKSEMNKDCFQCGVKACIKAFGSKQNVQHDCQECDCYCDCRYCEKLLICRRKKNKRGAYVR